MFTDLSHRALLFALCSFIMCACFTTCYLAQNRAETFLDFSPAPTLSFSRSALQVIDSRPKVALPAATSRQLLLIARRAPTEWWRKSVEDAASARCQREARRQAGMPHPSRGQTLISPPFSPSPPRSLSPSFSAIIIYNQRKEK